MEQRASLLYRLKGRSNRSNQLALDASGVWGVSVSKSSFPVCEIKKSAMSEDESRPRSLAERMKMFEQQKEPMGTAPPLPRPAQSRGAADIAKRFEQPKETSPPAAISSGRSIGAAGMAKRFEAAASPNPKPTLDGAQSRPRAASISDRAKGLAFNPAMLAPGGIPPALRKTPSSESGSGSTTGPISPMPMMGMPGMMGGARSMSAAAAGMGHLGDDLTAGDEASEQQQGRGGSSGALAPLATASRPTPPSGRRPKSRRSLSSRQSSVSEDGNSSDDDRTSPGAVGGGNGGPPRRLNPERQAVNLS